MSEQHPISGLMESSLKNLRSLVDANTVVGEPVTTPDGVMVIPVSKVTFGFAAGGADIPSQKPGEPFGGGSGGGVSVHPVAFLVIKGRDVQLLQINESKTTADRVVNMVPGVVDKISSLLSKEKKDKKDAPEASPET